MASSHLPQRIFADDKNFGEILYEKIRGWKIFRKKGHFPNVFVIAIWKFLLWENYTMDFLIFGYFEEHPKRTQNTLKEMSKNQQNKKNYAVTEIHMRQS